MIEKYSIAEGQLPKNGQYVLAHLNRTNWGDHTDPNGDRYFIVAKFNCDLNEADKAALVEDIKAVGVWKQETEEDPNPRPYRWDKFGPGSHGYASVDYWWSLPEGIGSPEQRTNEAYRSPAELESLHRTLGDGVSKDERY